MSFIGELKRRNVVKVAVVYLVAAWLILQVAEILFGALELPPSTMRVVLAILILGLPLALIFSWIYEMTPEGLKRESEITPEQSITAHTGQRINTVIIVLLVAAIALVAIDRLIPETAAPVEQLEDDPFAPQEIEDRSIAVLPFADLSPESDQAYFSDGIAEEILNVLVRVDDLSVASRTTSFGFKGQESLGIPYMAEKMRVRHILEGSVRKSGDAVRVTAQLIDASNDKHLWSETYDRTLSAESIFAIQDEIARAIVTALGIVMDDDSSIQRQADTKNLGAYEAYLEANQLFLSRLDLRRSMQLFEQAVAEDPQFARAWAGMSAVAAVSPSWLITDRDYFAISDEAANKALELDDSLALPYAVLGLNATNEMPINFEKSLEFLEQSLARNAKEATTYLWRGMNFMRIGYFDKALADFGRCLELDPQYELCRRHYANTLLFKGEHDRGLDVFLQGIEKGFVGGDAGYLNLLAARGERAAVLLAIAEGNRRAGETALVEIEVRAIFDPDYDFAAERPRIEAAYESIYGEPIDWLAHPGMPMRFRNYDAVHDTTLPFYWAPYPEKWRNSEHPRRLIIESNIPLHWRKHGFPAHCKPVGDDDFKCDIRGLHEKKRTTGWVN